MILFRNNSNQSSPGIYSRSAFTITELLVTLMVTMLVMAGLISAYLFGLRLYEFTKPKLSASDHARKTVGRLIGELRSADRIRVGQGSLSAFTEVAQERVRKQTRSRSFRQRTLTTLCITVIRIKN